MLVVLDLLEFLLGCCDGRGLVVDDVFQCADQFPHLLGGDSTGWIRRTEGISTPGSLPVLDGGSGCEVFPSEAVGAFLSVCGRALGPSRIWVRHRSGAVLREEAKLEKVLRRKIARHRMVRADDTAIVVSVNDRTQRNLTKRFDDTEIIWNAIEKQLLMWSGLFSSGKELTLKICFNYVDNRHSPAAVGRKVEKRGKSSVTSRMLDERDAQLDAEEDASGQKPVWRSWGKKHYQLKTHHLRRLVTYVEKGGVLDGHKDVPETVREELFMEEQQRLEKSHRKGGHIIGNGVPYPPININVLPSQSSVSGSDISAAQAVDLKSSSPLEIPGSRDEAVREYSEWQVSNVTDDTLKAAFRQVCDLMLEDGLDLEQVYKDQDPGFFIGKGIKMGIARRFVEDIRRWVENVKKAIPIHEII
ncbi:hypothetical protein DTO006G1_6767 [Penicillium roqueforti]|nr:hypothetical protein DTO006G1_6767 [Penicillium roqueforti]KAI3248864.1 hypothetical protein DTO006G7_9755 [Penicillium roqueforti]